MPFNAAAIQGTHHSPLTQERETNRNESGKSGPPIVDDNSEASRDKGRPPPIFIHGNSLEQIVSMFKNANTKPDSIWFYTPRNAKPKNLILKGIAGNFTENEIKNEVEELNLSNTKIQRITKIKFNRNINKEHFLIQLTSDNDTRCLTTVRRLAYQRVRWETLKRRGCTNAPNANTRAF